MAAWWLGAPATEQDVFVSILRRVRNVSVTAVRRLAIRNQRLEGPLPRGKATGADLLETVQALRCLQLDPTAVVARNHLLVLFSRHGAFDEADLQHSSPTRIARCSSTGRTRRATSSPRTSRSIAT